MTQPDPKYVSSSQPVNRRTASRQMLNAEVVNPVVQERLAAKWAKNRMGAPLAEQLCLSERPEARQAISPWLITGVVISTASAVTMLLALIQQSGLLALASGLVLACGLCLIVIARRQGLAFSLAQSPATPLFEAASLQAFDRALDALAPEATDAVATRLASIKEQLTRIARQTTSGTVDEHFTLDDRLYLTEMVRRYLPDSLQSYLMVPKSQRTIQLLAHGETAETLLLGQLTMLDQELDKREIQLTHSRAEGLIRQQRFLESKSAR